MVTKLDTDNEKDIQGLNLAKIHMVTKQLAEAIAMKIGLNLAKIHMVTKPQTYFNICI